MDKSEQNSPITPVTKDMISKKHMILFKAENDFCQKEKNGELVDFNFSFRRPISVDRSPYSPSSPTLTGRHHPSFFFRRFSSKELNFLKTAPRRRSFVDQTDSINNGADSANTPSSEPNAVKNDTGNETSLDAKPPAYQLDVVIHKPGKNLNSNHFPARVEDNTPSPTTTSITVEPATENSTDKQGELQVFTDFNNNKFSRGGPKILVSVPNVHELITPSSPYKPAYFSFTKTSPRTPKSPNSPTPKSPSTFRAHPITQPNSGPVALNTRKRKRFQAFNLNTGTDEEDNKQTDGDYSENADNEQHSRETDKPTPPHKKSRTSKKSAVGQTVCCIIGCNKPVTNRLRFSLRTHKLEDFKKEFLDKNWNKCCHYHYFSDLYRFKKAQKQKNGNDKESQEEQNVD